MFDKLDLGEMGKILEQVQTHAKKLQEESTGKTLTVKNGGGLLKISCDGNGEVSDVMIDDSLMEDKEALQILLIGAIGDLFKMVEEDKKRSALSMFSGLGGLTKGNG